MYLVWFLTIAAMLSILVGELGRFPFGSPSGIRLTDGILMLVVGFYLIWEIGIERRIILSKSIYWVAGFWLIGFLSLLINRQFEGVLYLLRFGLYSGMMLVAYNLVLTKVVKLVQIVDWLIRVGLLFVGLGVVQFFLFPNFEWLTTFGYDPHQYRLAGTFLDPNFAGCFLVLCSILAWWRYEQLRSRKLLIILAILSIAILLTFSRSAYLMWFLVWVIELWRNFRKGLIVLVGLLIITYLIFPRFNERINGAITLDQSGSARIDSWSRGWVAFESNPVIGVGFNNLRSFFLSRNLIQSYSSDGGNSGAGVDSSLLFILATTGVLGLISYLALPIWFLKRYFGSHYFILLSLWFGALLLNSQFINSLFYPPIMLMTFIVLGAVEGEKD